MLQRGGDEAFEFARGNPMDRAKARGRLLARRSTMAFDRREWRQIKTDRLRLAVAANIKRPRSLVKNVLNVKQIEVPQWSNLHTPGSPTNPHRSESTAAAALRIVVAGNVLLSAEPQIHPI